MTPTEFTPFASLTGGAMIGTSAVLLMALLGRIAGVSGIAARTLPPYLEAGLPGRVAFIGGLVVAPVLFAGATGGWPAITLDAGPATLLLGGLLVGFGSVWGAGCTSGHGVCGLARGSARSAAAVATFMTTAILTVFLFRHVL